MAELPTGTVTFLFTDLEVSTRLWERESDAMRGALARHDVILREVIDAHRGEVVKGRGDGVHAVFETAHDAVDASVDAQRMLARESWPVSEPLLVRMGLHTGVAELRDGDYFGSAVNRAARLMDLAYGGQVVCSEATADLARDALTDGVVLVDLGEHRLRDLSRAERVFQVGAAGLRTTFLPLRSLDSFAGNLPVQLTSFVGRETELAALGDAIAEARLLTLTGVGGVGKTRLALQLAGDVLVRFRDGVWLCELAAAGDAEAMVELIAATLDVRQRAGVSRAQSILEYLRSKELLLVLDNCEHVLDAAGRLVDEMLHECSSVRVVATSREGLAIAGEQLWPLRSLPVPAEKTGLDPATAGSNDAVRLFHERATSARPDFALDASSVAAVVEICRRLDGVPLAIELAAARVVSMTPGEIAGHLDERFRLLAGGRRNTVDRHQTLRATVEWSYSLLDETERTVFERLGVFSGEFDADAAVGVAAADGIDAWGARDALSGLVAKSMVVVDETTTGVSGYALLETMRLYALEQLAADRVEPSRRRHAAHYAAVAEDIGPALMGPDELAWRPRFRAVLDNMRAAFTWALDSPVPGDEELAVRIVAALADQAPHDQAAGIGAWAELAVDAAERSTPGRRTAVLGAAASSALYRGDFEQQLSYGARALRDGIPPDCPAPSPAIMFGYLRADEHSMDALVDAAATLEAIGAPDYNLTHVLAAEALEAHMRGRRDRARSAATRAVAWGRRVGNPTGLAASLPIYAGIYADEDPLGALAAAQEAIALTRAGASDGVVGMALAVAAVLLAPSDRAAALTYCRDLLEHFGEVGAVQDFALAVRFGTRVMATIGEPETAAVLVGIWDGSLVWLHPMEPADQEPNLADLRAALGDEAFDASVAQGSAMTFDESIDFVNAAVARLSVQAGVHMLLERADS